MRIAAVYLSLRVLFGFFPIGTSILVPILYSEKFLVDLNVLVSGVMIFSIYLKSGGEIVVRKGYVQFGGGNALELARYISQNLSIKFVEAAAVAYFLYYWTEGSLIIPVAVMVASLITARLNVMAAGLRVSGRELSSVFFENSVFHVLVLSVSVLSYPLISNVEYNYGISLYILFLLFSYIIVASVPRFSKFDSFSCKGSSFSAETFYVGSKSEGVEARNIQLAGALTGWGLTLYLAKMLDSNEFSTVIILVQSTFSLRMIRNFYISWRSPVFVKELGETSGLFKVVMRESLTILGIGTALGCTLFIFVTFFVDASLSQKWFFVSLIVFELTALASSPFNAALQLRGMAKNLQYGLIISVSPLAYVMISTPFSLEIVSISVLAMSFFRFMFSIFLLRRRIGEAK